MVKSMISYRHVCGLSHFENIIKIKKKKSFSVAPALGNQCYTNLNIFDVSQSVIALLSTRGLL